MKSENEARDRLLKAVQLFLKSECLLLLNHKDSNAEMKKRVSYFVDKITQMKKDLK